ncbi:putative serine/threonine protein kinase KIC1 [Lachancea thermotolerans CBS 6340]|uniref:non-specific serine/threonine protein kinase n=1 Tax=Lachancea thermotolerans (strain ATCC 56472 / CBS 6340 / NRRL Y-8284) TaxID=559295 RepID=C5DJI4_LACTC|nr:KLTH0F16676p [Lachancea thermotolerans CBS 6340]CAR24473.1 KLTH0F16676p [Lachancea thermotolerans CBS 6340]
MLSNKTNAGVPKSSVSTLFKRTEVIGRGKFGIVYKGYYIKTNRVCAIKVLNLDSADDEVEDVQKEVQFLSSLKQVPNITHYYGSYLNNTELWVIMEYCAGGSLRTLLRPGKIGEQYIGVIMRELLIALMHIHKDGVIHRDIKAANVLITNDGHIKLCDFGVAAQLSQTKIRRQTMAGTPYWMAPEVIMEGVYYDTKVDIWSLGITAYEIATGNPPYCDVEALRAMQLITKSKPPRLEGRQHSSALKEFIALCLDEDPKERPSAEELLKTKFIRLHKNVSASILKELISRYLLHRDKHSRRESSTSGLEEDESGKVDGSELFGDSNELDVKWDFDSLSSNEYIIENDINIDAIPEETTPNEHFSYAYPEDDLLYQSNQKFYHGTTMGKGHTNVTMNNSTIQASNNNNATYNNTTSNYQSKHTLPNTSKNSETKASKALLQLFEDGDDNSTDVDYARSASALAGKHADDNLKSATPLPDRGQHPDAFKGPIYHSQSTPSLPMLQTNFSQPVILGPPSSTALPTPIEIEIPEELPFAKENMGSSITKPRSSTVSVPNNKPSPLIQRRPTITGGMGSSALSRNDSGLSGSTMKTLQEDKQRLMAPSSNGINNKPGVRSSSPMKLGNTASPKKPLPVTPSTSSAPLAMKPVPGEKSDMLLKPLNGDDSEAGRTRINRDFKRQNPNLKLQMPSPTSLVPNKLLENPSVLSNNPDDANINQFGFNTSTATLPVAMTPVVERNIDLMKRKPSCGASTGNASRSSSVSQEAGSAASSSTAAPSALPQPSNTASIPSAVSSAPANAALIAPAPSLTMERPPRQLQMDMFLDFPDDLPSAEDSSDHHPDRKFLVLRELDSLLKTVEDGLPVMEHALKEAFAKTTTPGEK